MIRFLITTIEIILCFLLQTAVFPHFAFAGIVPDLLMVVTIGNAYTRGRISGLLTGLACGLLIDFNFGSVIGICGLLYMVTGYLSGYVSRFYAKDDYTMPILLIGAGELLYGLLYYIVEYLLRGKLHIGRYLSQIILPKTLYTVVAAVLLYRIMNGIHLFLKRREQKEE